VLGGNRGARRKTTRRRRGLQSAPSPPADSALAGTHLKLISDLKENTWWCGDSCSTVPGPQTSQHSRLCVFCCQSWEELLVKFVSVRTGGHSSPEGEAGPGTGARLPPPVFRGQVFCESDPSSAASLRSATRKCEMDGWLWGLMDQRIQGNRPTMPVQGSER